MRRGWMHFIVILSFVVNVAWAVEDRFLARLSADMYLPNYNSSYYNAQGYSVSAHLIEGVPVMLLSYDTMTIVAIRGSYSLENWHTNAQNQTAPFGAIANAQVHAGYLHIAQAILPHLPKHHRLIITGHSLGGGVGLLLGALAYQRGQAVEVASFGMQAVGNSAFVEGMKRLEHRRYVHILDPVPTWESRNIEVIQHLLSGVDTEQMGALGMALQTLQSMPASFVHHGTARYLGRIDPPQQDILPYAWMLPAYYHLAQNYANVLQ
ncbi:MAG: hypothetical protein KU37_03780 [Sulfuricurvum sp. PC08-66]|nr:MAG: hypothetical protein KU37_03780 [Sulfuricurvum sp. PC08-66]